MIGVYWKHGIRTDEDESDFVFEDLKQAVYRNAQSGVLFSDGSYGYLNLIRFMIPFNKTNLAYITRKDIEEMLELKQLKDIIIVAHSFGSALSIQALEGLKHYPQCRVHLILLGGIIRCSYDWTRLKHIVTSVYNFCSTEDDAVKFFPWFVRRGSCGYYGFRTRYGDKANVEHPFEVVWHKRPVAEPGIPQVFNIRMGNTQNHNDWLKPDTLENVIRFSLTRILGGHP